MHTNELRKPGHDSNQGELPADTPTGGFSARRRLLGGAAAIGVAAGLLSTPAAAHGSNPGRVVNVLDYLIANIGSYTPGVSDCTNWLRTLIASSSYDVFYFPAGKYLLTGAAQSNAAVTRSDLPLIMVGDGPQATQIIWSPSSDDTSSHLIKWSTSNSGLTPSTSSSYHRLEIRDMTLRAEKNLGTAIHGTRTGDKNLRQRASVTIENVEVIGGDGSVSSFKKFARGVFLEGLAHVRIRNFLAESDLTSGGIGIYINGSDDEDERATDAHLHQVTIVNFDTGVVFGGGEEGLMLTDSMMQGCNTGVYTAVASLRGGVYIRGNHLHCHTTGISLGNAVQAFICDNLFHFSALVGSYYVGIHTGSDAFKDLQIRGNTFHQVNSPPGLIDSHGILVDVPSSDDTDLILVTDNLFIGFHYGVYLTANASGVLVSHTNRVRSISDGRSATQLISNNNPSQNIVQ